ncbi:hypothetical protein [Lusitaniella coriacea]
MTAQNQSIFLIVRDRALQFFEQSNRSDDASKKKECCTSTEEDTAN